MNKIPMLEKFAAQSLVEHDGELIFSKEKFAELIVRECTDVCANFANTAPEAVIGAIGSAVKIKEHFGVEE